LYINKTHWLNQKQRTFSFSNTPRLQAIFQEVSPPTANIYLFRIAAL